MNNIYPLTNKHLWTLVDYINPDIKHEDYRIVRKLNKEYYYRYDVKQPEFVSLHLNERNNRFEGIHIKTNNSL